MACTDLPEDLAEDAVCDNAVAHARTRTLEEMILSIVDNSQDDYEKLLKARSASILDLRNWEGFEDALAKDFAGGDIEKVKKWVKRAKSIHEREELAWVRNFSC